MLIKVLLALLSGFLGSVGVGGGSVLLIYLSLFAGYSVSQARTINLLFFIPCALTGLVFHIKNKLIDFKNVFKLIVFGSSGVLIGYFLNSFINERILKIIFGVFVLILAIYQLIPVIKDLKNKPDRKLSD